ncbi:hypothetical protein SLE2022_280610 [Rubroshorea leprosula]
MAASLSFLITLVFIFYLPLSHADPMADIIARSCTDHKIHEVKDYFLQYAGTMDLMRRLMKLNKYAAAEAGDPPGRIYVFSQCMEDLHNEDCAQCFSRISTLLPGCFPKTGGRVYLDGCFIRADNYSFFGEIISDVDMKRCSNDVDTSDNFLELIRDVITKIVNKAPSNGGFAFYHKTKQDTTVCGMAQCWKTMDRKMCSECLADAANSAFHCLPSEEGRVLNTGCFLRYSNYIFGNDPNEYSTRDAIIWYILYILGAVLICTLAIGVGFYLGRMAYRRRDDRYLKGDEMDFGELNQGMEFLQFKYSTLEKATDCFNEANKLGSGAFGKIFKGTLPDGREIAIKRLYATGKSRSEEIHNEVNVISRAQHRNLARFLGCCFTKIESFLVYEYLANKCLASALFDPERKKELDWKKRLGIIIGTAEGLEYLHKGCQVRIIHRDIKASNILLDLKYRPKIADFGLARFDKNSAVMNHVAGTFGYMAPECIANGRLTEKVDVYSFGVLVLEIISGINNTKLESDNSFETLVTNAWKHFHSDTTSRLIDECLTSEDVEEIKRVIQVGLLCTQETPSLRPSMTSVIQMLKHKDVELPIPTKPPFLYESIEFSFSFSSYPSQPLHTSDSCSRSHDIVNNPN